MLGVLNVHGVMPRLQFSTSLLKDNFPLFFPEYSSSGGYVYTDISDTCIYEDYDYSGKLIMHTVQQNSMH